MNEDTTPTAPDQAPPPKPRKRRRVFLWVYLAIQVLFLVWIITGAQGNHCDAQGSQLNNSACTAGTGIGIALVVALWVATDIIVGGVYAVYRLSTRNK